MRRAVLGLRRLTLLLLLLLLLAAPAAAQAEAFPEPEGLAPNVRFWEAIYSRYSSREVVIHDTRRLDVIFHVFDLGALASSLDDFATEGRRGRRERRRAKIDAELDKVRVALQTIRVALKKKTRPEAGLAAKIHARLEAQGALDAVVGAAIHLRWQYGLADRFAGGVVRFEAWEAQVRPAFVAAGVPEDLIALAFVESLFEPRVRSFVGAAGVFQLMPATARELGLHRGSGYDERGDPLLAARAAVKMLRRNHERLGSWPLALTGYNHGPNGVARAVKQVGSHDLMQLIARYRSPSWGFASANFYAEFLAARRVLASRAAHFGPWVKAPPLSLFALRLPRAVRVREIFAGPCLRGSEREAFIRINPALASGALASRVKLPKGLTVYLPRDPAPRSASACLGKP